MKFYGRKIKLLTKYLLLSLLIVGWIFSGWPQIWNNPPFPPRIEEVRAATTCGYGSDIGNGQCRGFLTSGTSWTVPSDWNSSNNKIECIGAGGNGAKNSTASRAGAGGGGGSYAYITNQSLTPGSHTIQIGTGGSTNATYLQDDSAATVLSCGAGGNGSNITAGAAGAVVTGTGYSGGTGGAGAGTTAYYPGGGGAGSAGPSGAGKNGATGAGTAGYGGSGGGGSNGGSSSAGSTATGTTGANGGNGNGGTGGGTGGTTNGNPGTAGSGGGGQGSKATAGGANNYTGGQGATDTGANAWNNASYGPGGGGGGGGGGSNTTGNYGGSGGAGATYGGGGGGCGGGKNACTTGGAGGQGLLVVTYLSKLLPPTSVSATDGTYTDKVTITWTKSTNATGYRVYRDSNDVSGLLGDVATYDDTGADAPSITAGTASATDGSATDKVTLSISGASANNGTTHTYKVVAYNSYYGNSADSVTDTGYRGVGSLTYQWYRSSSDADSGYSSLSGATTAPYDDTTAPAGSITAGTASATDGSATDKVTLSISGASTTNGAGRYYYATVSATGATSQDTNHDRGYRGVGSLTYQWYRSSGDADSGYSSLSGATTAPYDDTTAPAPTITAGTAAASDGTSVDYVSLSISGQSANVGAGRYFYATVSATGASSADTTHDRGYIGVGSLTYQWQRSAADSDASYSDISGATTANYNDTGAPADGSGRYYHTVLNATGASQQTSAADRGYRIAPIISVTLNRTSFDYGKVVNNTTSSTLNLWGGAGITATNNGNVTENFDIYGANTTGSGSGWTLAGNTTGNNYIHKFCNDTDNDCSTPPTNYSTLTTSPQTLKNSISVSGTVIFQLQITTPTTPTDVSQQSAVVTIQASQ